MTRNCLGQYTFKNNKVTHNFCQKLSQSKNEIKDKNKTTSSQQSSSQSVNHSTVNQSHQNKKSSTKNLTEFNKKYEKFFSGTS